MAGEWNPETIRQILAIRQAPPTRSYVEGAPAMGQDKRDTMRSLAQYGLTPEEYAKAIELDGKYNLGELREMCRALGLSVSGDKKKLAARLLIHNREGKDD